MVVKSLKLLSPSILLILIISVFNDCNCQIAIENSNYAKNELNFNIAYILRGYGSISYERELYQNLSAGLEAGTTFDDFDMDIKYTIAPFVRVYFPGRRRNSFFVEIIGAFAKYEEVDFFFPTIIRQREAKGIGTSVGWKILSKKNFAVNIVIGGIANYETGASGFFDDIFPRLGIYMGKRF
jgi:hypothetical protein